MSIIIIGDVHGCYKTLLALIDKLPKGIPLAFVGDLIDRGRDSNKVVQFVIDHTYDCVMGNHEAFMVRNSYMPDACKIHDVSMDGNWGRNGGLLTLKSYKENNNQYISHVAWMKSLPLIMKYESIGLIVSHSSAAAFVLYDQVKYLEEGVIWDRPSSPKKIPNYFNVFGHTPQNKRPLIKDHYANIDTGCFIGWDEDAYGKLTALQFPEMMLYQQQNIED